jgi:hypothetical protein
MALIQLKGQAAEDYQGWLRLYKRVTGKDPGPGQRTAAFFAATNGTRPYWHNWEWV